jgi:hypothetical protein
MNANELAKWVEDENVVDIMFTPQEHYRGLVATMLRQQQSEIEALKVALQIMGINADSILRKAQEK